MSTSLYENLSIILGKLESIENRLDKIESTLRKSVQSENLIDLNENEGKKSVTNKPETNKSETLKYAGLRGIKNVENGCFMSSIIQSLAHLPYFIDICYRYNRNLKLFKSVAQVVFHIWENETEPVKPIELNEQLKLNCKLFDYRHHDAHEFLMYLLNSMDEELRAKGSERAHTTSSNDVESAWRVFKESNKSEIVDLFYGMIQIKYECRYCDKVKYKYDPISFVDVPVPATSEKIKLENCLENEYYKPAILQMNCQYCTNRSILMSRIIVKFPKITIMKLNRYSRVAMGKNNVLVDIQKRFTADSEQYQLQSIVNYQETYTTQHYTTYALNHTNNTWYCFDDTKVSPIDSEMISTQDAYILFYSRIAT